MYCNRKVPIIHTMTDISVISERLLMCITVLLCESVLSFEKKKCGSMIHPSFLCNRKIFGYFIFMRAPVAGQKRACMGFFPVKRVGSKPKSTPSCDSGRFSVQSVFPL